MKVAPSADVKARFTDYLESIQSGPVAITRNGRVVAALVALDENDDLESFALGHSRRLRQILEKSKEQFKAGKGIPHHQFWAEVAATTRKVRRTNSKRVRRENK